MAANSNDTDGIGKWIGLSAVLLLVMFGIWLALSPRTADVRDAGQPIKSDDAGAVNNRVGK